MLFKQINILDENLKLQEDCYVAVRNGKIVSISAQRPAGEWEREYDGRGKLLMSGFYNAHAHSPMTLMRGYGENLKLQDWLNKKIFPFEAKLDGNAVYWGTMLALGRIVPIRDRVHKRYVLFSAMIWPGLLQTAGRREILQ